MPRNETEYDVASALILGGRDHQEDAIIADFPVGSDIGVVVLSDGMGGHAAGDVASKIIMTEMFCELKFQGGDPDKLISDAPAILRNAATSANDCLRAHIDQNPALKGMGATLLTLIVRGDELRWLSVGDSPLYLFRGTEMLQLNEDHSMAPRIDAMAEEGILTEYQARNHPDRNALLSVCSGDPIQKVDCQDVHFPLEHGDIVIAASDGLQYLEDEVIQDTVHEMRGETSADIARALLAKIDALGDPEQDNTSMAIIQVSMVHAQAGVEDAVRSAFSIFSDNDDDDDGSAADPVSAAAEDKPKEAAMADEVSSKAATGSDDAADDREDTEGASEKDAKNAGAPAAGETDANAAKAEADTAPEDKAASETKIAYKARDTKAADKKDATDASDAPGDAKVKAAEASGEDPKAGDEAAGKDPGKDASTGVAEDPGTDPAKAAADDTGKHAGKEADKASDEKAGKAAEKDDAPAKPKVEPPSEDVIIAFVAEQVRAAAAEAEAEAKAKAEADAAAKSKEDAASDGEGSQTRSNETAAKKEKVV